MLRRLLGRDGLLLLPGTIPFPVPLVIVLRHRFLTAAVGWMLGLVAVVF